MSGEPGHFMPQPGALIVHPRPFLARFLAVLLSTLP